MSDFSEATIAALQETKVQPALLLEAEFATGDVRVWTGLGTLDALDEEWGGLGALVGVERIEQTDDVEAAGVAVTLRGVKPEDQSLALGELQLNAPGTVYLALFEPGFVLIDSDGSPIGDTAQDWTLADDDGSDIGEPDFLLGQSEPEELLGVPEGGLVDDPEILFRGRLDAGAIKENPDNTVITLNYENELIDLERPRERRYTDQDQKNEYAGDRGLEYIAALQDKEIIWGRR